MKLHDLLSVLLRVLGVTYFVSGVRDLLSAVDRYFSVEELSFSMHTPANPFVERLAYGVILNAILDFLVAGVLLVGANWIALRLYPQ